MLQPTVVKDSFLVLLEDISTAADSGWCQLDSTRLIALREAFMCGEYGMNILKKPSILSVDGTTNTLKKTTTDGNFVIVDGKHCIQALKDIKRDVTNRGEGDGEDALMLSPNLVEVLEKGINVSVLAFPDASDEDAIMAWVVAAHDSEANQFKSCSIADLVDMAQRYRAKQVGGKWKDAQSALEKVYGRGRRMFVYRMVTCAQALDAEVLQALAKSTIPSSWVFVNKYFVWAGGRHVQAPDQSGADGSGKPRPRGHGVWGGNICEVFPGRDLHGVSPRRVVARVEAKGLRQAH